MLQFACSQAATVDDVAGGCACELNDLPYDVEDLIDAASDALYLASGGAVSGRCETTVRPCSEGGCVCGWGTGCYCCVIDGITLPGPDPQVVSVKIDGVTLDPAEYTLANDGFGWKLVRTDGASWPGGRNPLLADTEDDTFSVTYESGAEFGFLAKMAAVELVCEMATVLTNRQGRLPAGTVAATMDQVSVQVARLPGQQEIEAVGLTWLARFLGLHGTTATSAAVYSPEIDDNWTLIRTS